MNIFDEVIPQSGGQEELSFSDLASRGRELKSRVEALRKDIELQEKSLGSFSGKTLVSQKKTLNKKIKELQNAKADLDEIREILDGFRTVAQIKKLLVDLNKDIREKSVEDIFKHILDLLDDIPMSIRVVTYSPDKEKIVNPFINPYITKLEEYAQVVRDYLKQEAEKRGITLPDDAEKKE